jgi:hypothetical protein
MEKTAERRQYPRFNVKSDVLAVLKPYPVKLGQVINISEGGIVFQYFGTEVLSSHYSKIDFFVTQNEIEYNSLPVISLWSDIIHHSPEKGLPMHQVGMRFDTLSSEQSMLLKEFIAMNTE